ncbi:hypothetical protein FHG87_024913 [Trinorchestia longiramus]|nr:hypothetical protein FHG87_024913 [Trinorchestia longiramus]
MSQVPVLWAADHCCGPSGAMGHQLHSWISCSGASGAVAYQLQWCIRCSGALGAVGHQLHSWSSCSGASGAVMVQVQWSSRCSGAPRAVGNQVLGGIRCSGTSGAVGHQVQWNSRCCGKSGAVGHQVLWVIRCSGESGAGGVGIVVGDEAAFHLDGKVNNHNVRTYAPKTQPSNFNFDVGILREKMSVWMGLRGNRHVIGPYFYSNNSNGVDYHDLINNRIVPRLRETHGNRINRT